MTGPAADDPDDATRSAPAPGSGAEPPGTSAEPARAPAERPGAAAGLPGTADEPSAAARPADAPVQVAASDAADDSFDATVIMPQSGGPAAAPAPRPPSVAAPAIAVAAAGWYGKLPALGDFASRRLPDEFVRPWDDWLQTSLAIARDAGGPGWLDLYLTFPVWRFVVPPGLLGAGGWLGVLLPSVDRVGRCFPLTICTPVVAGAFDSLGLLEVDRHLAALAAAGVDGLDAASIDGFERRLGAIAPLASGADPAAAPLATWLTTRTPVAQRSAWPLTGSIETALAGAAGRAMMAALFGRVLFWVPPDPASGAGVLRVEPFPLSDRLLGSLIGS
ncbi:MAG: type VI secretion system-associated protein TagF [Lautropia sp.]